MLQWENRDVKTRAAIHHILPESEASWEEWWTYDGISGPSFWGLINPQWSLCSKGRRQSPINIEPDKLLFDRHLRPVHVDKHKVSGNLHNTGQFLVFRADREAKIRVNITGGPLAYHYQFEEIYIHYGLDDNYGSEHRINNYAFPAEIQVYGFNAELYHNMSEAQHKSQGLVAISLMVQLGEKVNPELQIITSVFNKVVHRVSEWRRPKNISLRRRTRGWLVDERGAQRRKPAGGSLSVRSKRQLPCAGSAICERVRPSLMSRTQYEK
ncbi:carbonic anhydrase-related protein 10 isoform X5 [Odontomachus brunneus]|uniref:carbonic anhydrase-related protein 10 isoform X5 n=1 Tax=Odontomachus brunneus TaxID=486640 RepID=UPI0013F1F082|nr:carbonic anhydrase-related protein 10 isoform X5 [Odontomachus brunneus]